MNKSEFKYVILDQRAPLSSDEKVLQDEFFTFWQNYWNEILRSVGVTESIDPSEFFEQDKVTALYHTTDQGSEIVTMHMMTFISRGEYSTSPYLKKFDAELKNYFSNSTIGHLQTLQYLAFSPAWKMKKEKPSIYLPMVIVSLSFLHKQLENCDASISVARKDLGVFNALEKMNFQAFLADGNYNNTPVSYQISYDPRAYPHPQVDELVQYFWNHKIEVGNKKNQRKEAA